MHNARHIVTAVVVAHDGARWLPETLDGLFGQTRPVDRALAVDNGSRDGSAALLAEAFPRVITLSRSAGFGEAVAEAVRAAHPVEGAVEWLWLLHDDCAPAADALECLLEIAEADPRAAVLGPKLLDWLDRRVLVEIGVTVDKGGRRETGLEYREYDQGQHDGVRESLAVSTAGMLVRRDVFEQVGGFDDELPLFRDDIDLCWRIRAAGHRVLVVTDAVAWHAEAASRRRRRIAATGDHPRRADRRNALYVLAANLPTGAFLAALVRGIVGSLLRTLLFLLAKQPANALDEIAALAAVLGSPGRIRRARKRRGKAKRKTYPQVRKYFAPPGQGLRRIGEMVRGWLAGTGPVESAGRHHAVVAEPGEEEGEELLSDSGGLLQRIFTSPAVLLTLALLAVTLVAERSLLAGEGRIGGGALPPVYGGARDLWDQYLSGFHPIGVGTSADAPPYVAVLAVVSTLLLGKPWLAVTVLLLGCVPLAGLTAYLATRRVLDDVPARLWIAASYALLPVATGAIAAGRLGTAVVFVLLPVYAVLAAAVIGAERRVARRAAWALGLLLAVGTAFAPLVWLLALPLGGLAALAFGGVRRGVGVSLAIALLTPAALLGPWLYTLVLNPPRFLLEAGLHRPGLVDARLAPEALLLLSPGGPGMPPVWVTGGVVFAALAGLLLRRHRLFVAAGWTLALFGVLVAILVARTRVAPVSGGPEAHAWPGVALAFAATGLLVAAGVAARRIGELRAAGGVRRLSATLVVLVACAAPLLAAGAWIWKGAQGPLDRDNVSAVPALAAATAGEGERARTLILRVAGDGRVDYTIVRGRDPLVGEPDIPVAEDLRKRVDAAVAGLASGRGGDDVAVLGSFAVRFVVAPGKVPETLARTLDSQPGLARVSLSPIGGIWQLTRPAPRLSVVDAKGAAVTLPAGRVNASATVPSGGGGRLLVLREPAGPDWRATLDGVALEPRVAEGWAQAFALPEDGGVVTVTRAQFWRDAWVVTQGLLVLVVVVLALPGAKNDDPLAESPPEERPTGRRGQRRRGRTPDTVGAAS
ncbi:glycosyltransferase family 2 protein [Bailinhaonella thermotolerans]|uniref:Glycosyltransferase family 2 protein n=1 Tax=Bailinhaonella thermotolerans TaxID=1070861 RepID=A0A3A4BGQ0_9ACTN|nr:glycosyltransferase family 2 protein [Bailinhaonella thermotolerans]RJL30482.1 glycosyltransferase family 2 protein [Bailinhaonella thermotolerans]